MDAINYTEWYLFKAPLKKAFTFMLLNTKRGINITAGGMANVNNEVLVAVSHVLIAKCDETVIDHNF